MDKYEVISHLGKGSFGSVFKVRRNSDQKHFVWKEIHYGGMQEQEKKQLVCEVNILRSLKHPNIVRYADRMIDKEKKAIFIVMEYCPGGDLRQLLKQCKKEKDFIAEDVIWKLFLQVSAALQACHYRPAGKILHRDLKPGNILLDQNMNVKLCDFGLSKMMEECSYAYTHVGTPYYMSPEQVSESKYNEKSDVWSMGCLLYEMATLSPPFQGQSFNELSRNIRIGKFPRIPRRYSEELQNMICWMLNTDHMKRPNINDIMNSPNLKLRTTEKNARDEISRLKRTEEALKIREENALEKKRELKKRLEEIKKKEELKETKMNTDRLIQEGYQRMKRDESLLKEYERGVLFTKILSPYKYESEVPVRRASAGRVHRNESPRLRLEKYLTHNVK